MIHLEDTDSSSDSDTDSDSDKDNEGPPKKRTCFGGPPDVTVVVGGKEFSEYSRHLRCCSDYFDAAFRSGMKETQAMRFEFPERDPNEWPLVMSVTRPFAAEKIREENVYTLLPWFDELRVEVGLNECDKCLCSEHLRKQKKAVNKTKKMSNETYTSTIDKGKQAFDEMMKIVATSIKYNLPDSKIKSLEAVKYAIKHYYFLLEMKAVQLVTAFVDEHSDCRAEWWGMLQAYLPTTLTSEQKDELVGSKLLPAMLLSGMNAKDKLRRYDRMVEIMMTGLAAKATKKRLSKEKLLHDIVPLHWR